MGTSPLQRQNHEREEKEKRQRQRASSLTQLAMGSCAGSQETAARPHTLTLCLAGMITIWVLLLLHGGFELPSPQGLGCGCTHISREVLEGRVVSPWASGGGGLGVGDAAGAACFSLLVGWEGCLC